MEQRYPPLKGLTLVIGAILLSFGNFIVVLDTTITNVAIPTISGDLGVSTTQGTWVITTYAVAEAITVPLTGWLGKQFGEVRVFLFCVSGFLIFSTLCGFANSLEFLIVFRIFQGLTAGPLIPLSATLLLSIFPKEKSHSAMAIWGMMTVIAPIFGPILGGYISDNWHWSWIFFINIFFCIILIFGTFIILKDRETKITKNRIDYIGLFLLVIFVTAFQIMLDKGRELDWFESNYITICAIISFLSFVLFIIWEITEENPIIDLSVVKSKNWTISTLILCFVFCVFFGNVLISPLWLQKLMGYTATWSGLAVAPIGILAVITSPIIGKLIPKIDTRIFVISGIIIIAFSFYMRALLNIDATFASVAIPTFVLGAGIPACMITLTSLGISELKPEQITSGSGLQNFLRIMSMAIGSSLSQTYWEHMTKLNRVELLNMESYNEKIQLLQNEIDISSQAAYQYFSNMIENQAVMLATNDFYANSTILILLFGIFAIFLRPLHNKKSVKNQV
ncbi:DHA2 family efflux MFS transporter permease subunit [Halarcobacter anaerophilus]|uniref:MFS transporter n=1 Tax=Halarcobacter anaerophilus TaxID=877500 RepID=A0A4Q0Y061_9BACT|nr:DHA2 family efflux MFS transporter permease subunit [Halarcobacter anaerophilus]QDF28677.1 multidrug resistance efflux protein, EmrB family [Halarcobacter anaerophilus]RXJ63396.1 MFS transporter [Halarcobacter anaerophilus]